MVIYLRGKQWSAGQKLLATEACVVTITIRNERPNLTKTRSSKPKNGLLSLQKYGIRTIYLTFFV